MTPPAAAAPAVPRRRAAAPARKLTPAPRPRRVSGPARQTRPAAAPREQGLALGLAAALGSVVQSRRLDRLIRGRAWIAIVAFALIGIVTLQLGLLKLNAGMGQSIVRAEALQRQNATLAIENSQLAAGSRVEALAARLGMVVVPSGTLRFLHAGTDVQAARAASALTAPSSTATAPAGSSPAEASAGESSSTTASGAGETKAGTQEPASSGEPSASGGGTEASQAAAAAQQPAETQSAAAAPTAEASAPASESAPAGGTKAGPGG